MAGNNDYPPSVPPSHTMTPPASPVSETAVTGVNVLPFVVALMLFVIVAAISFALQKRKMRKEGI